MALYRESLHLRERNHPPDHPALAPALYGLAIVELERGERERALESFDRALHIRLQHGEDPGLLAENAFAVEDLLWTTGRDRSRALELARRAIELGATDPEVDDAAMQAWLDSRIR